MFDSEDEIIMRCREIVRSPEFTDNALLEHYEKLLSKYEKLVNDSKKIIRLSDRLQNGLNKAIDELHRQDILKEYDLQSAKSIQKNLMPDKPPEIEGFSIASIYIPTDEVGGDFFDYTIIDNKSTGFFISDVSGHGVSASLITSLIKSALDMDKKNLKSPSKFMNNLQAKLLPLLEEKFFTAFYGVLNRKNLTLNYSCAGHLDQLVIRNKSNDTEKLFIKGPVIGFFDYPGFSFSQSKVQLFSGDLVVLFTDGIIELFNGPKTYKTQYGHEGLIKVIRNNFEKPVHKLIDLIIKDAQDYQGRKDFEDDIALILVKIP